MGPVGDFLDYHILRWFHPCQGKNTIKIPEEIGDKHLHSTHPMYTTKNSRMDTAKLPIVEAESLFLPTTPSVFWSCPCPWPWNLAAVLQSSLGQLLSSLTPRLLWRLPRLESTKPEEFFSCLIFHLHILHIVLGISGISGCLSTPNRYSLDIQANTSWDERCLGIFWGGPNTFSGGGPGCLGTREKWKL